VLITMVGLFVKIEGSLFFMFWVIFISSLCGLTLGLLVSALADTSDKAVGVLPIILIPQILFSGTVVEIDNMVPVSQGISNFMVLRWSYGLLKKISIWHKDFQWDSDLLILLLFVPLFILGTLYFQKRKDLRH